MQLSRVQALQRWNVGFNAQYHIATGVAQGFCKCFLIRLFAEKPLMPLPWHLPYCASNPTFRHLKVPARGAGVFKPLPRLIPVLQLGKIKMNHAIAYITLILLILSPSLHCTEQLSFLLLNELSSSALAELSSEQLPDVLKKYQHQHISIRGFIYQTPEGKHILAAEPNLKSCCVASQEMITRQIQLFGNSIPFSSDGLAKTLEGQFEIEPVKDENGNWKSLFVLYEPKIIENKSEGDHRWLYLLGGLGLISIGIFFIGIFFIRTFNLFALKNYCL